MDLEDGRERWRTLVDGSTGRGALCGQDVLIPFGRTLLRLGVGLLGARLRLAHEADVV